MPSYRYVAYQHIFPASWHNQKKINFYVEKKIHIFYCLIYVKLDTLLILFSEAGLPLFEACKNTLDVKTLNSRVTTPWTCLKGHVVWDNSFYLSHIYFSKRTTGRQSFCCCCIWPMKYFFSFKCIIYLLYNYAIMGFLFLIFFLRERKIKCLSVLSVINRF